MERSQNVMVSLREILTRFIYHSPIK